MQEQRLQEPFLKIVILANFTSSVVSVHSSINSSTNFFLHLQFL